MLKQWIVLLLVTTVMLAACRSPLYNQTEGNIADVKLKTIESLKKSDRDAKSRSSVMVKQGAYVDTTPVAIDRSPAWLSHQVVITGDQVPFSYLTRLVANGANHHGSTRYQVGLDPEVKLSLNYTGTLKGALDLLATRAGYVYTIRGNIIYWQAFVTRTFEIAFMPGSADYAMGGQVGGAGGGGGTVSNYVTSDASSSEFSSLKGSLSLWKDLETTIKQLLSPEGKVFVSQSTTSVTVNDKPTNVELVSQYISNLNRNLSKQVLVKVQILEVNLDTAYDFGINWQLIMNSFKNSPFVVNANYGTPISITALTSQPNGVAVPMFGTQGIPGTVPAYTILFNALNQQGKTSVVSEPRVVCLNNQVSAIRIVAQESYVASIQNTTVASGGTAPTSTVTSQVTPGTVITGLTLYILPKILKDSIYLQVNADISTNLGFQQFGPPTAQIQLPNITQKGFNQRSVIHSGDTLILAGFRQLSNRAAANQFITSQALGGKGAAQFSRETVILITPIILNGTSLSASASTDSPVMNGAA